MKYADRLAQLTRHRRIQRQGVAGLRELLSDYRGAVPAQRNGSRWP